MPLGVVYLDCMSDGATRLSVVCLGAWYGGQQRRMSVRDSG